MSYVDSNSGAWRDCNLRDLATLDCDAWAPCGGMLAVGFAWPGAALLRINQNGMETRDIYLMEGSGVALLICGAVVIVIGMVRRNATEMAVTNHRVVIKTGLIGRKTVEMLLNKVESIEVSETALGRMLAYGTIVIIGTGGTSDPFHKMAHPLAFRSQVQQQIE